MSTWIMGKFTVMATDRHVGVGAASYDLPCPSDYLPVPVTPAAKQSTDNTFQLPTEQLMQLRIRLRAHLPLTYLRQIYPNHAQPPLCP